MLHVTVLGLIGIAADDRGNRHQTDGTLACVVSHRINRPRSPLYVVRRKVESQVTKPELQNYSSFDREHKEQMRMDMKLELVPVPVSDIDRAKAFYVERLEFQADHDVAQPDYQVQRTPKGSACSIVLGTGLPGIEMPPGSLRGIHLVVSDLSKTRAALTGKDVAVSDIIDLGGIKYASFSDPDGNTWTLQEMPSNR